MKTLFSIIIALMTVATSNGIFAQTKDTAKTATIKVSGIDCSTDLKTVTGNVKKLKGVSSFRQTGKTGTTYVFKVKFNPALVTEKEINAAIESTGGCENPEEKPYKVIKQ